MKKDFRVVGIDNFSTGTESNIDIAIKNASRYRKDLNFTFVKGDIRSYKDCEKVTRKIDVVFHQAALGSVQRSLEEPIEVNEVNVCGTMNMLKTSIDNNVKKFIFASSSSVYGDSEKLPKIEEMPLNPKSIYAATKVASEYYVRLFYRLYGLKTISLRYFNVFGKRQNPDSIYSAVIPIFLKNLSLNKKLSVFGDGEQGRDFTHIDNVVYANLLSMVSQNHKTYGNFYNVACGEIISLNEMIKFLEKKLNRKIDVFYKNKRKGDVDKSLASLKKIREDLGYKPVKKFYRGLVDLIKVLQLGNA